MAQLTEQRHASQYDDEESSSAYIQSWLDNVYQPSLPGSEYESAVNNNMSLPQTPIKFHKHSLHTPNPQLRPPTARPRNSATAIAKNLSEDGCSFEASRPDTRRDRLASLPKRKQVRSTISDIENIPPGAKLIFEKRPRHKTRKDRYDTKRQRESRGYERPLSRQQRKAKKQQLLKSRKEVMKNFSSTAVRDQNLIMKPNLTSSLFLNGRGSVITPLADLTFNEMSFSAATRNREHIDKTNPSNGKRIVNNTQDQLPATVPKNVHRNTKRKRAVSPSHESSLFVRSPHPGEEYSDSQCSQTSNGPTQEFIETDMRKVYKNTRTSNKEGITAPISWSSSNRHDMSSKAQTNHDPSSSPDAAQAPFTSSANTTQQPPVQYADKALSPIWDSFDPAGLEKRQLPAEPESYGYTYCHYTRPEILNPNLEIATSDERLFNMVTDRNIAPEMQYITDNRNVLLVPPQSVMNEAVANREPLMDIDYSQSDIVAHSRPLTEFDMEMRAFWRPNVYM